MLRLPHFVFLILFLSLEFRVGAKSEDSPRLNQIQMKGTHNSYHLSSNLIPWSVFAYSHAPIQTQLAAQGVRQFEFDIHQCAKDDFCVYHIGIIDSRSSCETLRECLLDIELWSRKNSTHHPIFIMLEPKDRESKSENASYFDSLEKQISEIFPKPRLLIPDDVRKGAKTLRAGLRQFGWPKLDDIRGRVVFVLLDDEGHRDNYVLTARSLQNRLMFTLSAPEREDAAIMRIDNPLKFEDRIRELVSAGFIVRTRADDDLKEFNRGDFSRLNAARNSGAQIISTDIPAQIGENPYFVSLPSGNPSRCNPVLTGPNCKSTQIENL